MLGDAFKTGHAVKMKNEDTKESRVKRTRVNLI